MTVSSEYFLYLKPGVDNGTVTNTSISDWIENDTTYTGYTGSGHTISTGTYGGSALNGARMPFDISAVPAGTYKLWVRVYTPDSSSDSAFMKESSYNFFGGSGTHGSWAWVELSAPVIDGSESTIELVVRESDFGVDSIIIVDTAETTDPSGDLGYTTGTSLTLDVGSAITVNENSLGNTHTFTLDGIGLTVTAFTSTSTVSGVVIVTGTPVEVGANTEFPVTFSTGAAGSGLLNVSITASGVGYSGGTTLAVEANVAPTITDSTALTATTGVAYSDTVVVSDADGDAYTVGWGLGYAPPLGMHMTNAGVITWTPVKSDEGTEEVTVRAEDALGNASESTYEIEVSHTDALIVVDIDGYRGANAGKAYTLTIHTTIDDKMEGTPALAWADSYTPPSWLSMTGNVISGTPAESDVGVETLYFKTTMTGVTTQTFNTTLEVFTVSGTAANKPPVITNKSETAPYNTLININVTTSVVDPESAALTYAVQNQGGKGVFALVSASAGTFTYTPAVNQTGNDVVAYNAYDGVNTSIGIIEISIGANPTAAPTIAGFAPAGTKDTAYTFTPTYTNGVSYSVGTGLPVGIDINTSTGVISGTPTVSGTYAATVTVVGSALPNASMSFVFVIADAAVAALPDTTTAGELIFSFNDPLDVRQILNANVQRFSIDRDVSYHIAESDQRTGREATFNGSRDKYFIKIPEILPADLAEYQVFETAILQGEYITVDDPNSILPEITFPFIGQQSKSGIASIARKATCAKWEMTFTLDRIM
ncbi:MAG: hypothetical protein GY712_04280 [Oceanicoccus sp.]|uniref:putative Ig domain-containing protein n=1 Tax=Oceanicoccus sp. TaxID=2691044 RepID=UPI0026112674|nr:putative Ig domain-containing protein [Oceanicoccus sp.]MCP3907213.1 hypothetical protein [Oceanicoccus sp.]